MPHWAEEQVARHERHGKRLHLRICNISNQKRQNEQLYNDRVDILQKKKHCPQLFLQYYYQRDWLSLHRFLKPEIRH